MANAKAVEHATVSLSFNIEVANSFCGYVRFLHLDITVRTVALTHGLILISLLIHKKSRHRVSNLEPQIRSDSSCYYTLCTYTLTPDLLVLE